VNHIDQRKAQSLRQTDHVADVLCSVVVGRQEEVNALEAALEAAGTGRGGVVVLTGEAGIGKSRLTREVMAEAEKKGVLFAVGRAVPSADAAPYRPLTEAMLQVLRDRPLPEDASLTPWLPALTAIVPALGGDGHGEASAAARGEAVIRLLRRLGGDKGVVVVLEDLHWADPDTLAVVEYLAGNLSHERILCVITARSEAPSAGLELIRRLRGRPGTVHLPLARLDEGHVARMVRACVPAASDRLLSRVQQSAEGIPLLVEELLASPGVPRSFADTVTARLAEFSSEERLVLETAAVLGRSFDWHLLSDATGLGADVVAGSLGRAVECLLITVEGGTFRFRHALTRDAVVEAMLPPRRAQLAARVLSVIEVLDSKLGDGSRELAADLAAQAGDRERAGTLLAISGRTSVERGALATAVETLRRASEMLAGNPELVADTERTLVEALALAGRVDEAITTGNRLIGGLHDGGAATQAAEIHLQLAHAAVSATRWSVAVVHLDAAKELLATEDPPDLGTRVAVLEAEIALAADDVDRSRQLANMALSATGSGADVRCHALEILGRSERLADLAVARQTFERALSIADENGLPFWRLRALHELGTIEMFESGGTDRLDEARRSATELGALSTVAVLDLQIAVASGAQFRLDAGAAHARESLELAELLGLDQVRAKALYLLAENHTYRRDRDEMERYLALALSASSGDPAGEGFAWGARGTLAFLEDDWTGALVALGRAAATFAELPYAEPANFRGLWPLLLASAGDRRAEPAIEEARRAGIDRAFANRGLLGYAEAIVVGRREPSRATELALAADADLTFSGPWGHFPRLCAAEPARSDHWGDPKRWLHAAADCFAVHSLDPLAARCRNLLDPQKVVGWAHLDITAREVDVLSLVADGLSNKDIASRLQLSPRTVEKHIESLMRKTGTRSRTQLAVTAGPRIEHRTDSRLAGTRPNNPPNL
jgi:DNA-binding CsgD family transcriptional regulator/tetratricopeptide (TPR) repeat protein